MNVIHSLFIHRKDKINPNEPANRPHMDAMRGIQNKALIHWVDECGGGVLIDEMLYKLASQIEALVMMDATSMDKLVKMSQAQAQIQRDLVFVERILTSFQEEEKRQNNLKE